MLGKIVEKIKAHKLLCVAVMAAVLLAAIVLILIFVVFANEKWTGGGTYTKGAFRYRRRYDGALEVRVDTTGLPEGELFEETADSGQLQTADHGLKGEEHVYYITCGDTPFVQWTLALYEDGAVQDAGQPLYVLVMGIRKNDDGKLEVLSAEAQDLAPEQHVMTEAYDCMYQIQESGAVYVQISVPMQNVWYSEYDTSLLYVQDFFYEQEYSTTSIYCATDQEFDTEVCFYTLVDTTSAGNKHVDEIHLRVKGKDGVITEVTHE